MEQQLLIDFATNRTMSDSRQSCLVQTLSDARTICGFNPESGEIEPDLLLNSKGDGPLFQSSFSGLIMYLISLEMIGKVFNKKPNLKDTKKNGIKRAVEQFSGISKEDKFAIVALRNSLVHTTGLVNLPLYKNSKDLDRHKFSLNYVSQNGEIVKMPSVRWNGKYSKKEDSQSTTIHVIPLIKAIEAIYERVVTDLKGGFIELNLEGGIEELKARYTLLY
mgnify:CR=1 FL=1